MTRLLALFAAGALWGTSFVFGKVALRELSPAHLMLYRFVFCCVSLAPFAAVHGLRVRRALWPTVLLAAFLGVPLQFLVQFEGLARTTASHAALMVGAVPIVLAAAAVVFHGERPGRRLWLALVASTAGAVLVAASARHGEPGGPTLLGDLLVVASLVGGVAWVLLSQRLMREISAVAATAAVLFTGTAMLAAWVLAVDGPPPTDLAPATWLAAIALGVVTTTATSLLWNWGLQEVPASRAGVFVNLEPVVGTVLGLALLHEPLGALGAAGGLLIVASAVAVTLEG